MAIKYIDEVPDLKGKKVLLLLDLNVPVIDGKVADAYRLEKAIEVVDFLRQKEAQIIIISHIEDSDGNPTTLLPVWDYLKGYFSVDFSEDYFKGEAIDKLLKMKDKDVLLFENIRSNFGEKENNPEFAKKLSQMADLYVNDAFSVSHRKHASVVSVPKLLPHYGGMLLREEIKNLSKAFNPNHPFVFILGGAKFDTKLPLIKKYLDKADFVFVGGALASNIFKEKGFELGTSLVSKGDFGLQDIIGSPKLVTPVDVTVTKWGANENISFKTPDSLAKDECIVDVGPETIKQLKDLCSGAKTIVWNGPLGNYEIGFSDKTESLAEIVSLATENGAESIIGGGDTIASINKLGINDKFSFISTGGGAMLDFLLDETLPGIEALKN